MQKKATTRSGEVAFNKVVSLLGESKKSILV